MQQQTLAAIHNMRYRITDANRVVDDIERLARRAGIGITVNFAAELANCHDALAELTEYLNNWPYDISDWKGKSCSSKHTDN